MEAIDMHAHFGPFDRGPGGLLDRLMSGGIEVIRRRAAAADIRLTVVSAIHALMPYGGDPFRGNEDAVRASETHSDIRFWAVLDPRVRESYDQVGALLDHSDCVGIKIHPQQHMYEIRDYGDEVFAFAAEREALVMTHSGHAGSFPEDFTPFVNRYPKVKLILAHLGNSTDENPIRQVHALKCAQHGNVYVDTSSKMSMNSGLIEWAVGEVGADRLLFGTDSPLYFSPCQKARIEYAEMEETAKRAILYENAKRLLGIGNI